MKSGIELITEERQRQITKGYTSEHDEDETAFQLSSAAAMFIANALNKDFLDHTHYDDLGNCARFQIRELDTKKWSEEWPWEDHDGREKADVLTSLTKAGALIAAEIDRLNGNSNSEEVVKEDEVKAKDIIEHAVQLLNVIVNGDPLSIDEQDQEDEFERFMEKANKFLSHPSPKEEQEKTAEELAEVMGICVKANYYLTMNHIEDYRNEMDKLKKFSITIRQ